MAYFDTHEEIQYLKNAGIAEQEATAIVRLHAKKGEDLATKSDLKLEISELRYDLKSEISELRSDFKEDMSNFKSDITAWSIPIIIGIVTLNLGIFGAMIALWFK
jgi:predicted phage-related endonuclease